MSPPKIASAAYIDLPADECEHCNGLAIDFGGSVIKVAYRPKDKSLREGEPPVPEGKERIRLAAYVRADLEHALTNLMEIVDIRRENASDEPMMITTGVGSNEHGRRIQEVLKIKTTNIPEMDCFVSSFQSFYKNLKKSELATPVHPEGHEEGMTYVRNMLSRLDKVNAGSRYKRVMNDPTTHAHKRGYATDAPFSEEEGGYPFLFILIGSGAGTMKMNESGSMDLVDFTYRGGRSFLGLSRLLTGATSYEEIISLAEAGDDSAVSTYTRQLIDSGAGDGDANYEGDQLLATFGNITPENAGSVRREDLARALVEHYAADIAQMVDVSASVSRTRNAFFVGNFTNADILRRLISKHIAMRGLLPSGKTENPTNFYFCKIGGHLGALGAFVHKPKAEGEAEEKAEETAEPAQEAKA